MKRVRTISVIALGWLGTAVSADDPGWKTAAIAPSPTPPKVVEVPAPVPPALVSPADASWKSAPPPPKPALKPEPIVSGGLEPLPPKPVAIAEPSFPGGLEPLPPPVLRPVIEPEIAPAGPVGPRVPAEAKYPAELPPLPMPKIPSPEPLPAPRALPIPPSWNPQPICNDTPEPTPSATLQRASAVTPAEAGIPVRHGVFGSQPVRLSKDNYFRDLFGLDLLTHNPNPIKILPDSGSPDDLLFVQAEYLLWWANKPNIPVLATTNSLGQPGFLGQSGTRSLLGPGTFGPGLRDGFRIRAGGWLDDCGLRGVDGGFFFLGRRSTSQSFDSGQSPVITRPFFAPNFNSEFGEVVAQPNLSAGRLDVTTDSFLWGADLNYRRAISRTCDGTVGLFAGYRHLNLTESLTIAESITSTGPLSPDPVGTKVFVRDRFETRNQFHGGQVGGFWSRKVGRFDFDTRAGVALGTTFQTVDIDGIQQRTRPGQATENFRGGLLATGPNLGRFTQNHFSVVPEFTANVGYRLTPNLRLFVGYNFLYWSNVVRPGDQIDRVVDLAQVPNPPAGVVASPNPRPLPTFQQSDFWAHGVQFGLELRW